MAAGLGFKDFTTGEVLTAADVDGYLMQGVWVFASAAARDAAVTSPEEGNFAYLKDTNTTTYYTGSAWTNLDTTGMVNPMTTTGDTIYSSSGSTPARLAIGSTGQVLTVAGGVPSWATPAGGGGVTLISTQTVSSSAANITFSSISSSYKHLMLVVEDYYISADDFLVRFNNDSGGDYNHSQIEQWSSSLGGLSATGATSVGSNPFGYGVTSSSANNKGSGVMWVYDYNNTGTKFGTINSRFRRSQDTNDNRGNFVNFSYTDASAISEINLVRSNGSATINGTFKLYGVN